MEREEHEKSGYFHTVPRILQRQITLQCRISRFWLNSVKKTYPMVLISSHKRPNMLTKGPQNPIETKAILERFFACSQNWNFQVTTFEYWMSDLFLSFYSWRNNYINTLNFSCLFLYIYQLMWKKNRIKPRAYYMRICFCWKKRQRTWTCWKQIEEQGFLFSFNYFHVAGITIITTHWMRLIDVINLIKSSLYKSCEW